MSSLPQKSDDIEAPSVIATTNGVAASIEPALSAMSLGGTTPGATEQGNSAKHGDHELNFDPREIAREELHDHDPRAKVTEDTIGSHIHGRVMCVSEFFNAVRIAHSYAAMTFYNEESKAYEPVPVGAEAEEAKPTLPSAARLLNDVDWESRDNEVREAQSVDDLSVDTQRAGLVAHDGMSASQMKACFTKGWTACLCSDPKRSKFEGANTATPQPSRAIARWRASQPQTDANKTSTVSGVDEAMTVGP